MAQAYIVDALRTAGGRRGGKLADWHPADLGGLVLDRLVQRTGVDPSRIEDVIMGCVLQVGEQAFQVGRNAVLASSLPESVPAVTIDRQCGSSQQALQFAAQAVLSGTQDIVIAAGVESMTRVAMGSPVTLAAKAGMGVGPISDRIEQRYGRREFSQFDGAEAIAVKHDLDRETLDAFSLESHRRAAQARNAGAFVAEIVPVPIETGEHVHDEGIRDDATLEGIAGVKLLREGGRLSAASASQICDGASAALIVSERALKDHGLTPIARIDGFCVTAGDPVIMLEEPIAATRRVLDREGRKMGDIDLFEVNEAFASIPLAWAKALDADLGRVNINGGSIALGHPLGATGVKLMATLVHALRARGGRFGLQTMCEGGGIANAMIVEAL
ncbi:acetyl-CoA C-acetyltransferase [Sphingomonas tabacisoli]|uniref:Acetyl-CoA C-acetyltransferase n=1 Tax=Sphingomonas tabacisoli TaxID=2249466 RepID=A0ABW4I197_9SPHN